MNTEVNIKKEIKTIVDQMGFHLLHDPTVTMDEEQSRYLVGIFVDDPKQLIGERGNTLRSFQHVFRMIMTSKYNSKITVDVDVNGYKRKRAELLRNMAFAARKQALQGKRDINMEPMNAFDRRIVHTALSEYEDVQTESVGDYPDRRVVVRAA